MIFITRINLDLVSAYWIRTINRVHGLASTTIANILCAILLTAVGILGSAVIDDLKANFFHPDRLTVYFWIVCIFYVTVQSEVFHANQRKADKSQRLLVSAQNRLVVAQDELMKQTTKLELLVTTLPPKEFLQRFAARCVEAHDALKSILEIDREGPDKITREELVISIRGILSAILELVALFDQIPHAETIAANVMIMNYPESYAGDGERRKKLTENLKFAAKDVDPDKLKGILDIHHELSVSQSEGRSSASEADGSIKDIKITLPVSNLEKSFMNGKLVVVPGAPLAALVETANGYGDTESLRQSMNDKFDLTETVAEEICQYFLEKEGKDILSFWSFPLTCTEGGSRKVIGVLNIHKNATGLLTVKDRGGMFNCVMAPIFDTLAEFLELWLINEAEGTI